MSSSSSSSSEEEDHAEALDFAAAAAAAAARVSERVLGSRAGGEGFEWAPSVGFEWAPLNASRVVAVPVPVRVRVWGSASRDWTGALAGVCWRRDASSSLARRNAPGVYLRTSSWLTYPARTRISLRMVPSGRRDAGMTRSGTSARNPRGIARPEGDSSAGRMTACGRQTAPGPLARGSRDSRGSARRRRRSAIRATRRCGDDLVLGARARVRTPTALAAVGTLEEVGKTRWAKLSL